MAPPASVTNPGQHGMNSHDDRARVLCQHADPSCQSLNDAQVLRCSDVCNNTRREQKEEDEVTKVGNGHSK